MTTPLESRVGQLLDRLSQSATDAVFSEALGWCRVDRVSCNDADLFDELKSVAAELSHQQLGTLQVFGEVEGALNLTTTTLADMENEQLAVIFEKPSTSTWAIFYTERGFVAALGEDVLSRQVIWVSSIAEPFTTFSTLICGWDGPREFERPADEFESPRTLVRDRTYDNAPAEIAPWLLFRSPIRQSASFPGWRRKAIQKLAFCIPFEIEGSGADTRVILKGSRTIRVPVSLVFSTQEDEVFAALSDAALWIYSGQRDAETRFVFFNNHLSLDWKEGDTWPLSAVTTIRGSLTSARDAYAFYLQEQSRDALRSLTDLRRGLQDEVTKVQQASRDLVNALWRDFAIAAAVLAIRYVPGMSSIPPKWLKVITLAAAALLLISLIITLWSNARYNSIAKRSREDWRSRLYAFIDAAEWDRLVLQPLRTGLRTYRLVGAVTALCYLAIIGYLFYLGQGSDVVKGLWKLAYSHASP
jgi:hypothetical protein